MSAWRLRQSTVLQHDDFLNAATNKTPAGAPPPYVMQLLAGLSDGKTGSPSILALTSDAAVRAVMPGAEVASSSRSPVMQQWKPVTPYDAKHGRNQSHGQRHRQQQQQPPIITRAPQPATIDRRHPRVVINEIARVPSTTAASLLVHASSDGWVRVVDTRMSGKEDGVTSEDHEVHGEDHYHVMSFREPTGRALLCVGASIDGHTIAAGTEKKEEDAFVRLWDLRNPDEELPPVVESIGDDVTQVRFHPMQAHILCTGSTDGLACMLDVRKTADEDDALMAVMNSESSVSRIGFFGPSAEYLYMTTHIETFSMWSLNSGDRMAQFDDARETFMEQGVEYLIDAQSTSDGQLWLYAGSHELRVDDDTLHYDTRLAGGHTSTVRCITSGGSDDNMLWTGGEDGVIAEWTCAIEATEAMEAMSIGGDGRQERSPPRTPAGGRDDDQEWNGERRHQQRNYRGGRGGRGSQQRQRQRPY